MEEKLQAIVFSDLHLKNHITFSEWREDGLTDRAVDCLSVIDIVFEEAKKRSIDTIFFAGDLFHDRSKIDVSLFNTTYKKFLTYQNSGISVFCVAGNHDQTSKNEKDNSIQLLDNIKNVYVLNGEVFEYKGWDIVGIPATEDKTVLIDIAMRAELKNPAILLTHSQVSTSVLSNGFKLLNGLPISDLSKRYVGVVCGDIHQFQVINDNIIIPGSSVQHNFGDKGIDKFVLDVSFKKNGSVTVEPINTNKPEFLEVTFEQAEKIEDDYNFYKILCDKILDIESVDNIRKRIKHSDFVYDIDFECENNEDIGCMISDHVALLKKYVETLETGFSSEEIFSLSKTFL